LPVRAHRGVNDHQSNEYNGESAQHSSPEFLFSQDMEVSAQPAGKRCPRQSAAAAEHIAWCRKEPDLLVLRIARNTHQNIKPIVYEREGVGHRLRSLKRSSGDTSKTGRTKRSASLQNRGALAEKWVLQVPLSPFQ